MSKIIVVGSINIDNTLLLEKYPNVGETVLAYEKHQQLGGKGANQAVSASRLGANVSMLGAVGRDANGEFAKKVLLNENVDVQYIQSTNVPTGEAIIEVCDNDNRIVVLPSANYKIDQELIRTNSHVFNDADICIIQFEIREEVCQTIIDICKELDIKLLINPAPFRKFPIEWIEDADFIIPNKTEFNQIFPNQDIDQTLCKYKEKLIVTLGSKGVKYCNKNNEIIHIDPHKVEVVDTTGAGDTFVGAFAFALAENMNIYDGIKFANRASSIAIQKIGAQDGMPTIKQIDTL